MNDKLMTAEEATQEAANKLITAIELDIVVSKTREINRKRDRDIKKMESILDSVESKL